MNKNNLADNENQDLIDVFDEETTSNQDNDQSTSPVESSADETKRYAMRLNKDREKIRSELKPDLEAEIRANIAKDFGYESWDEYMNAQTDSKLLEQGLDPDQVKPIINDLLERDPRYVSAMKFKEKQEREETERWAQSEVEKLNKELGLNLKSVNDLDEATVNLWSSGVNLKNAYIANHYDTIQDTIIKKTVEKLSGKDHLTKMESSGSNVTGKPITDKTRDNFFRMNPGASEEKYKEYLEWREKI